MAVPRNLSGRCSRPPLRPAGNSRLGLQGRKKHEITPNPNAQRVTRAIWNLFFHLYLENYSYSLEFFVHSNKRKGSHATYCFVAYLLKNFKIRYRHLFCR